MKSTLLNQKLAKLGLMTKEMPATSGKKLPHFCLPLLFNALKVGGHLVLNLPVSVLFEEFTVNVAVVMDLLDLLGGSGVPTAICASQFGGTRDEQALVLLIHLK